MPVTYVIHPSSCIVITTGLGIVSFEEIKSHQDRLLSDPEFSQTFDQLIDWRGTSGIAMGPHEARSLATRKVFSRTSRRALVAPCNLTFGVSRMLQTYNELSGQGSLSQIFRDVFAALDWLGRKDMPLEQHSEKFPLEFDPA